MCPGGPPFWGYWGIVVERVLGLLEPAPFKALAEDIGDSAGALNFLRDYLHMLPGRMARIIRHLNEPDREATMDALLSLRVTSAMTGAQETERRCRAIEALVRCNQLQAARAAAHSLDRHVDALVENSQDLLVQARADLQQAHPCQGGGSSESALLTLQAL